MFDSIKNRLSNNNNVDYTGQPKWSQRSRPNDPLDRLLGDNWNRPRRQYYPKNDNYDNHSNSNRHSFFHRHNPHEHQEHHVDQHFNGNLSSSQGRQQQPFYKHLANFYKDNRDHPLMTAAQAALIPPAINQPLSRYQKRTAQQQQQHNNDNNNDNHNSSRRQRHNSMPSSSQHRQYPQQHEAYGGEEERGINHQSNHDGGIHSNHDNPGTAAFFGVAMEALANHYKNNNGGSNFQHPQNTYHQQQHGMTGNHYGYGDHQEEGYNSYHQPQNQQPFHNSNYPGDLYPSYYPQQPQQQYMQQFGGSTAIPQYHNPMYGGGGGAVGMNPMLMNPIIGGENTYLNQAPMLPQNNMNMTNYRRW